MQLDDEGVVHGLEDESFGERVYLLLAAGDVLLVDDLHRVELVCMRPQVLSLVSFTMNTCPKAPLPSPRTTLKSVMLLACLGFSLRESGSWVVRDCARV